MGEALAVYDPRRMTTIEECDHEIGVLWVALLAVSKQSRPFVMNQIDALLDRRNELSEAA